MRPGVLCLVLFALAGALNARSIGVAVNGVCEGGSCPAVALPFNSTGALSVDFTITLSDGDMYLIDGSFTDTNNGDGSAVTLNHLFQVTYQGNATGGASLADSVTVQVDSASQTALGSGSFNSTLLGAFVPQLSAPVPPAYV
jgi:hypothetical protein